MSCWTLVQPDTLVDVPSTEQLKTALESKNDVVKISAMKTILRIIINGDPLSSILMHVIRYVMPSKNKELKKLLFYYWEVCPKYNSDGTMKQEMILACNSLRNELQHPNEYIRGATLRFLCKLKEPELLEPLIPTVRQCLEHRHAYVRKNAILAVLRIYQLSSQLLPDAPSLAEDFITIEQDATCKRNAFMVLCTIAPETASLYLLENKDAMLTLPAPFQLVAIEFIRKTAINDLENKSVFFSMLMDLLQASSNSVVYEAATSLMNMTFNTQVIKIAASKLLDLAIKESDNNAKIIMLERIAELVQRDKSALEDLVPELLRLLSTDDEDVCKKTLDIIMGLLSTRNVQEVLTHLQKELVKSAMNSERGEAHRRAFTDAIHSCAILFPPMASSAIQSLLNNVSEFKNESVASVVSFVKEVMEKFPDLRSPIIRKLLLCLREDGNEKIYRGVLWMIGEYCLTLSDIGVAWKALRASLGNMPVMESVLKEGKNSVEMSTDEQHKSSSSRKILPDGTYATESAITASATSASSTSDCLVRTAIVKGDHYLASILACALTKLVMRSSTLTDDSARINSMKAEAMLIIASFIRFLQSDYVQYRIDDDTLDRMMVCIRSLHVFPEVESLKEVYLQDSRLAFSKAMAEYEQRQKDENAEAFTQQIVQADDLLQIRQITKQSKEGEIHEFESDISKAAGDDIIVDADSSKLDRVVPLTGFTDPVYVEAYVKIQQFDIILDILLVNRTSNTLQNLSLELATLGNIKLVERPPVMNLGPNAFKSVQATVKVSSIDTGVIFGSVVFDGKTALESRVVILNGISINIMDYIKPVYIPESEFRSMWTEVEWENKVDIVRNEDITVHEFLHDLMKKTNMKCLTPESSLRGDCQFLSANLYARSIFGEDALMSLSIEKTTDGKILGHVRIRSKTQGVALSLGSVVAA
ncbi:coatomer beta subunit [Schizosaccharomyces japonicus yFS275]|uniref:Coatomer subunit beta n=1 Tax=Schizosaccharomyces japonicus (strain yFS275 / FY16936) TaxID=402676 RepID=B6K5M6_SCHJY|nr:coatomer beta subunit [Schizosaccharomyces japonicus yFS275]EEB08830.1 coatomer beta subunit [Schizosaccharomyces japonicus yFS275]